MKGPELDWACPWIINNLVVKDPKWPDSGPDKWIGYLGKIGNLDELKYALPPRDDEKKD